VVVILGNTNPPVVDCTSTAMLPGVVGTAGDTSDTNSLDVLIAVEGGVIGGGLSDKTNLVKPVGFGIVSDIKFPLN
jgi:hypothetical protein